MRSQMKSNKRKKQFQKHGTIWFYALFIPLYINEYRTYKYSRNYDWNSMSSSYREQFCFFFLYWELDFNSFFVSHAFENSTKKFWVECKSKVTCLEDNLSLR